MDPLVSFITLFFLFKSVLVEGVMYLAFGLSFLYCVTNGMPTKV